MAGRAVHEGQPGFSGGVGRGWKRHDRWATLRSVGDRHVVRGVCHQSLRS